MSKILVTNGDGEALWSELAAASNLTLSHSENGVNLTIKNNVITAEMISNSELITGPTGHIGDTGPTGPSNVAYWGSFWSDQTQTNPTPAIIRSITLNHSDTDNNGVTIQSNSQITCANAGVYNIQFSAQLEKTDNGVDLVEIWLSKNGTNIADTNTKVTLNGNGAKAVAAWNFLIKLNAGDYIELKWYSADTHAQILAEPAVTSPLNLARPAIPSIILTAYKI
jgi:hypothetical protein